MCWRHAPREYAAIHFHDDDLHDAGWATDFDFTVPADLPSGAYVHAPGRATATPTNCRSTCGRPRGRPARGRALHRLDLHLPGLRQPRARLRRRGLSRAGRRVGRLPAQPGRPSGLRPLDLQPPPRRQRHLLLLAPAPGADLAAALSHLPRRARLGHAPLPGRHAPARLARGAGHRVRRGHRRGRRGRGRGAARPVRDRAHRLAPRVPHRAHARRPRGLPRRRRAARLPGRQRLLLAHRHQPGGARRDRGAPRRGRHPRLGGPARRVLSRARRPVRRPLAAQRTAAAACWSAVGFSGQGLFEGSHYRRQPGADDPRAAFIMEGVEGRGHRRLRPLGRRRRRLRAGPRGRRARHAARRGGGGLLGRPRAELRGGAGGAALAPGDGERREAGPAAARGHDLSPSCRAAARSSRWAPSPSAGACRTTATTTTSRASCATSSTASAPGAPDARRRPAARRHPGRRPACCTSTTRARPCRRGRCSTR